MKKDIATCEMDYRISESIFLHMALAGYLTEEEYEILRDRPLDIYQPVISELERGFPMTWRARLKPSKEEYSE